MLKIFAKFNFNLTFASAIQQCSDVLKNNSDAIRIRIILIVTANAKIAQLVERDLAKVEVAGSSPVFRSVKNASFLENARVVELVDTLDLKSSERLVRAGSSPALSTKKSLL